MRRKSWPKWRISPTSYSWLQGAAGPSADPQYAFSGPERMKADELEIDRLHKQVGKRKVERDIPEKCSSLLWEGRDIRFSLIAKHPASGLYHHHPTLDV